MHVIFELLIGCVLSILAPQVKIIFFSDHGNDLHGPYGQIASPFYPISYDDDETITWRITVEHHHKISIKFLDLYIMQGDTNDCYNYISLKVKKHFLVCNFLKHSIFRFMMDTMILLHF